MELCQKHFQMGYLIDFNIQKQILGPSRNQTHAKNTKQVIIVKVHSYDSCFYPSYHIASIDILFFCFQQEAR